MAKYKHLTFKDRNLIQSMLNDKCKLSAIADTIEKDPSTVSKEIRAHITVVNKGGFRTNYNSCVHRFNCTKSHICIECHSARKFKLCKRCSMCNAFCSHFEKEVCNKLSSPPYVCNGCSSRAFCSLQKYFYYADTAEQEYRKSLSDSRKGFSFSEEDLKHLDEIITPLIKQGQSPHHICVTNSDSLMVSESTLYRLIDARAVSAMNMDLPRKVRFRHRKKSKSIKIDRACRINRDYECFKAFMTLHPDFPVSELDSVEGIKGGKVLLTIHFPCAEFMLAFIRDYNDSKSVTDIFNHLYLILGFDLFTEIFKVCLTDNGSEFSNPKAIEFDSSGVQRTSVFYCDPSSPYQKGSAERNHEFIRLFVPKGKSFDSLSQAQVSVMMDHINSYCRSSLGNKSPYEMFSFIYGNDILDLLGCHFIPPQDVTLNKSVWNKEV